MSGLETLWSALGDAFSFLEQQEPFGCATLLLGLIFVWSGIPKVRHPTTAAFAIVELGVSRTASRSAGLSLGVGEIVLAMALAVGVSLPGGGVRLASTVIAAGLLWLFVCLVARALRSAQEVTCFCFGDGEAVISTVTLLRTAVLALLATAVAIASSVAPGTTSARAWFLELSVAATVIGMIRLAAAFPTTLEVPHECA